jgi:hypothetical protein
MSSSRIGHDEPVDRVPDQIPLRDTDVSATTARRSTERIAGSELVQHRPGVTRADAPRRLRLCPGIEPNVVEQCASAPFRLRRPGGSCRGTNSRAVGSRTVTTPTQPLGERYMQLRARRQKAGVVARAGGRRVAWCRRLGMARNDAPTVGFDLSGVPSSTSLTAPLCGHPSPATLPKQRFPLWPSRIGAFIHPTPSAWAEYLLGRLVVGARTVQRSPNLGRTCWNPPDSGAFLGHLSRLAPSLPPDSLRRPRLNRSAPGAPRFAGASRRTGVRSDGSPPAGASSSGRA